MSLLQDDLSSNFQVSSFVKPGANMKEIVNTVSNEIKTLQSDDFIVVWGGANDIWTNNMREARKSVSKFMDTNQDLNIVLINSPCRYDLIPESCLNNEVNTINRQVKKIMQLQSKVKILELTLDRHHFTSHGLHLNFKRKKVVSQNLALIIKQFFNKENKPPLQFQFQSQLLGQISLCTSLTQNFKIQTRQMNQNTLLLQLIIEDIVQREGIQIFYGCER